MAKIIRTLINGGQVFFCPGCKNTHAVNSNPDGPRWAYNENPDKPTFSPSILVTLRWSQPDSTHTDEVCHSFVTLGKINFLPDSTHELAGTTVDLPPWPYEAGAYGGIVEVG